MRPWAQVVFFVAIICFAAGLKAECDSESIRTKFVEEFIKSALEETDFFFQYANEGTRETFHDWRQKMTRNFKIAHWDYAGPSEVAFDYVLEFDNGAAGFLSLVMDDCRCAVKSAALDVRIRADRQPQR